MDLTEFMQPAGQPPYTDEESMQPSKYPADWEDVAEALIPPAACQESVPRSVLGPGYDLCAPFAVNCNHAVTSMPTATQYDTRHPVSTSMNFHPVPCHDKRPNITSRPQSATPMIPVRDSRPRCSGGSTSSQPSGDSRKQRDTKENANGLGERARSPAPTAPPKPVRPGNPFHSPQPSRTLQTHPSACRVAPPGTRH